MCSYKYTWLCLISGNTNRNIAHIYSLYDNEIKDVNLSIIRIKYCKSGGLVSELRAEMGSEQASPLRHPLCICTPAYMYMPQQCLLLIMPIDYTKSL